MRVAMIVVALAACSGTAQYGSFVAGQEQVQGALASDAAKKLSVEYTPDSQAIRLVQDAQDPFGRALATELRKAGYSVKDRSAPRSADELHVRYVVDRLKGTRLLRVTVHVQRRRLSRAYGQRADGVYPAGPWSSGVHDED